MSEAFMKILDEVCRESYQQGYAEGLAIGTAKGERRAFQLIDALLQQGRYSDLERAEHDKDFRKQLYSEFHIE